MQRLNVVRRSFCRTGWLQSDCSYYGCAFAILYAAIIPPDRQYWLLYVPAPRGK